MRMIWDENYIKQPKKFSDFFTTAFVEKNLDEGPRHRDWNVCLNVERRYIDGTGFRATQRATIEDLPRDTIENMIWKHFFDLFVYRNGYSHPIVKDFIQDYQLEYIPHRLES